MAKKSQKNDATYNKHIPIWPHQVEGGKYVKLLQRFVQSLREEDAVKKHGNQKLFLDDVFIVSLLSFYNASIKSLRTIEDFSQTQQAQKHLSTTKICKSTLSDFNALADPERLQPLIEELRKTLETKQKNSKQHDNNLTKLLQKTVAVDGTFLPALADVAWAIQNKNQHATGKLRARFDVLLPVDTWLPDAIVVPEPKQGEAESARHHLQPGKLYLFDRGYNSLPLIAEHYNLKTIDIKSCDPPAIQSEFIIRLKGNGSDQQKGVIGITTIEEQTLTEKDREAGVMSDLHVRLSSQDAIKLGLQNVVLREVVIEYKKKGESKTLRLLTNLSEVAPHVVGQLYRYRWQVELFFRWLKSYGNFRHLISQTKEGMQLNLYVAIIGIMLMYLHTGYRPSKYMFPLLGMVANGSETLESIMPILRERERRCALARESKRRYEAKKRAEKNG